jgi:hypothetical protein
MELCEFTLATERCLEDMIAAKPRVSSDEWMLIDQQTDAGINEIIDLLAKAQDSSLLRTLTYDKGEEMPRYEELERKVGIRFYFTDPHSPLAAAMSPCQLHRDCIHCEDLVCVKGDEEKTIRLRQNLDEAR